MEESHIEERKPWKRRLFSFLGLVVAILVVFYFLFSAVWGNVLGLVESESLNDNIVDMGNQDLIFINDSYSKLFDTYYDNLGLEFKACLMGSIDADYFISDVFFPEMYFQKHNQVISAGCPKGTLVSLHSHPDKHCLFSEQDKISFESSRENFTYMAVLCDEDRFNFYQ